jgi:hypothetical protein
MLTSETFSLCSTLTAVLHTVQKKTMVNILLTEEVTEHVRYSYLWHNACILFAADFVGIYLVTYSTFFSTRTELRYLMTVCQLHIPVLFAKDAMIMCSERK